ncbi:MAG: hypothetical protein IPO27_07635 [Bacteroidetes bacterium]|nr:hypothetical protein [Bacteroidota bacterium]
MPQKLEPLLPGCYYHIYNHANGNENLFNSEANYLYFLEKYVEYIHPIADTFAYCSMPNHFHFFVRIKDDIVVEQQQTSEVLKTSEVFVSQQFSNFFNAYSKAINKERGRMGSLFNHRYKRKQVFTTDYFINLIHYIHLNPIAHGFVKSAHDWKYSSYHSFLTNHPTKINRDEALKWFDDLNNFKALHQSPVSERFILDLEL